MTLAAVRRRAESVLSELGIHTPPVPVEEVAKRLGLRIVRADLGADVSGVLVLDKEGAYICVQQSDAARRRRFTIGHEIGHFVLKHRFANGGHVHVDRGNFLIKRSPASKTGLDRLEVEANQFAASLLMPGEFVKRAVAEMGPEPLTDLKVSVLAKRFEVSEQAMTIRLSSLGFL